MKRNKIISLILLFSLLSNVCLFADSNSSHTPEPYNKEEFPQALKDLRRFEIITLGSMPFVMLDCNMVYSGILYAQGQTTSYNPLSTANYSTEQQLGLILTSLAISTGIGLTDLIVQNIKRNKKTRVKKIKQEDSILVMPIEEDPDAIKIELPDSNETEVTEESDFEDDEVEVLE